MRGRHEAMGEEGEGAATPRNITPARLSTACEILHLGGALLEIQKAPALLAAGALLRLRYLSSSPPNARLPVGTRSLRPRALLPPPQRLGPRVTGSSSRPRPQQAQDAGSSWRSRLRHPPAFDSPAAPRRPLMAGLPASLPPRPADWERGSSPFPSPFA